MIKTVALAKVPAGYKVCTEGCQELIGARTIICKCGHYFPTADTRKKKRKTKVVAQVSPVPAPTVNTGKSARLKQLNRYIGEAYAKLALWHAEIAEIMD